MNVGFLYDDVFLKHENPSGHPECKERLVSIINALKGPVPRGAVPPWDALVHIKPRRAAFEDIELVHTHDYVERMKKFTGYADPDTYVSKGSLEAALFAAGAVMEAVDRCRSGEIQRAFCAIRPPGHHAEADRAMGFCIFNNIAIGARHAQRAGYKKVFIVDFDVHHGNGTQHMFEQDDSVFYMSTHQYPHYPGTGSPSEKGKGNILNIPLPAGSGDGEYLSVYRDVLPGVVKDFAPDIVLVSAGYDIHIRDPLSQIRISNDGIKNITGAILSATAGTPVPTGTPVPAGITIPAIFCLEGGYDLDALSGSVLLTVKELLEHSG